MITEHFSLEELIRSSKADELGIENKPTKEAQENLKKLCVEVLEPIRQKFGKPIYISSGYRCAKLNKAVGGASNSDHKFGAAADIKADDNKALWNCIMTMVGRLKCRQIIDEYGLKWIHLSINNSHNAIKVNQILHLK